jgi:hypothetical protein
MNDDELKQLETNLRSWRPRRPSAMLKWRLGIASGKFLPSVARFASLLVPAAACVLLAILSLNSENSFSGGISRQPMMAMISSNQNCATYWAKMNAQGENCPPSQIFKWTNDSASPFSMRFEPFQK